MRTRATLSFAATVSCALLANCDEKGTPMTPTRPAHTNALIHATSPYLLQHAHNPVEWREWGPVALELAAKEDKPIFLSIGYSACHWCHVMAHESFEDEQIAAVMNERFVNIKVDREERPDIDEIYMQATLILNQGQGGWPMSVWLTPELKPFFAGTYFPPRSKWGRPGFAELCERIGQVWKENRAALEQDAARLSELVDRSLGGAAVEPAPLTIEAVDKAVAALAAACDTRRGGLLSGGTNKFPPSMAMDLFLRAARRGGLETSESKRLVGLVETTLDHMARGGIYDHLAGGICRYSTDAEWHVPHFEKMLYDQALVSRSYVDAFQVTGAPLYRRIATEIFDYVLADLRSPEGGFYSARDADSEGEEGKYYVWTRGEIVAALGADADLFCSYYDVSESGNWSDPHAPGESKNVLRVLRDLEAVAKMHKLEPPEAERRLAAARRKLLDVRSQRTAPGLDDKILVEWNGLMIAALAHGGAAFDEKKYVDAAGRAADFLLDKQHDNGRLFRAYRAGQRLETAFLSDYACLIEALLELYEATFDEKWLTAALALNQAAIERFWDEHAGGFFFTADDHERLITRSKDVRDGAVPSGNSVQLMNLLRLAAITGDAKLRARAERTIACFGGQVTQMVGASERFLAAVEFAIEGPVEIAIVGDPSEPATRALIRAAHEAYLPNRVLMLRRDGAAHFPSPLLEQRERVEGRPAAYVCRNYVCERPETSPQELARSLGKGTGGKSAPPREP